MIRSISAFACCAIAATASAEVLDWSEVTLAGDNPYTFTDDTLGDVTITYSGNFKDDGIITTFGQRPLLGLGEGGVGSGTVTVSWQNPLASLNLNLWDLDLGEFDLIHVDEGVDLSLVADNPRVNGDDLIGNMMTGGVGDVPNASTINFAEVMLSGSGITEFAVEFQRPSGSGSHAIGFGEFVVPAPGSAALFTLGAMCAARRRR